MKKILALALALAGAASVSACYTPQQQTGTLAGGAIGAGTGALIGSAVSHGSAGGAIAGGLIGAGTGALIGNAVTAPPPGRRTAAAPMRPVGLRLQRQPGLHRFLLNPKGGNMKKTLTLALALAGALSVSACYTPQQQTGTLAGGAIGAGGGALIGSAVTGGSAGGAIAGGIIGAGTGALIGNAVTAPRRHCARWGWNTTATASAAPVTDRSALHAPWLWFPPWRGALAPRGGSGRGT